MVRDVIKNRGDDEPSDDDKISDLLREAQMRGFKSSGVSHAGENILYRILSLVICLIFLLL